MTSPSATAGLSIAGEEASAASTMLTPPEISVAMSWPISADGTMPKNDSAEYRPPMSDGLMNTSRKCSARARFARSVPSSVIAMK